MAGAGSGCGKTTASILLMAALRARGLRVAPCKVGPDYIDTGFHRAVCGVPSHNLDAWLMEPDTIRRLLLREADVTVIEGVMGYYDGLDARDLRCSTWELGRMTRTPALLVVDASGSAASAAAVAKGFMTLRPDSGVAAVLVNRASSRRHYELVRDAVAYWTGLPCVGWLGKQRELELPSRQLGLVPAGETRDLLGRVERCAEEAARTLDLDRILGIASSAPAIDPPGPEPAADLSGCRIGVALDDAFHFYYEANLGALTASGARLVMFSPLRDGALPAGLDALYIGGGYPEVFAKELAENRPMRDSLAKALSGGLRCYAECGGLMYLGASVDGFPMTGFLPLECRMTDRLQRFGYVTVEDRTGLRFPAHEFHHAESLPGPEARFAYTVRKASAPEKTWRCGYEKGRTLAAFAHAHFAGRPELMRRFFAP